MPALNKYKWGAMLVTRSFSRLVIRVVTRSLSRLVTRVVTRSLDISAGARMRVAKMGMLFFLGWPDGGHRPLLGVQHVAYLDSEGRDDR